VKLFASCAVAATVVSGGTLALRHRQPDAKLEVRRLVDAGQYEDAEREARAGGDRTRAQLGDVLVLRGKLRAADSVFAVVVAKSPSDRMTAEAALAELALRRGDHAETKKRATAVVNAYVSLAAPTVDQHIAAGRAYKLLTLGNREAAQNALTAFGAAMRADSTNLDVQRRIGDLFLERSYADDARTTFQDVLRRAPTDARALFGIARVEDADGKGPALVTVNRSLQLQPTLAPALAFAARLHLESERYDSASVYANRAIAADSSLVDAWALLGATAWLKGDSATYRRTLDAATALQPRPADFYVELAEAAIRQRRYADANELAKRAVALDSLSTRALATLGVNQTRLGQMEDARASLSRDWELDQSNARTKNVLDLLDLMRKYRTIESKRLQIVAPEDQADVLALYLMPLLERAFDTLSVRYAFRPRTPVRIELFDRSADFSVRTVGATGIGALGVSFGNMLAMDAPNARERGTFNWGSTAWHELTHTFTLGASEHRVPRWLSEGMSVFEERRASPGWGANQTVSYISAFARGMLRPMSQLNDGFLRPRYPEETQFSYYQASLFCEFAVSLKGEKVLPAMLVAYRDGVDTPGVFQRVLGLTTAQVDAQFDAYERKLFAIPLKSIGVRSPGDSTSNALLDIMRKAIAQMASGQKDSAQVALEQARAMFPEYSGNDGPSWYLALLARDRRDTASAVKHVSDVTLRNETAWDANLLEADLREPIGDIPGAMAALERSIWISPYDVSIHARLANMAAARGDFSRAIRERRAIIALKPSDLLDARFGLARALASSGDVAGARRELLQVLEQAPSFEKAQGLLLELRSKSTPSKNNP